MRLELFDSEHQMLLSVNLMRDIPWTGFPHECMNGFEKHRNVAI